MNRWLLVAAAASVGLAACSQKEEAAAPAAAAAAAPQSAAPAAPPAPAAPVAVSAATPNSGKILQLEQGGGYSYAEVETAGGEKVWIAGGQIAVKVGDTVQWGDSAVMNNFTSKSLGRTFDRILFVNAWGPAGATPTGVAPHGSQQMAGGHPPMGQQMAGGHPPMGQQMAASAPAAAGPASSGKVKEVLSGGGYIYLEVEQADGSVWVAAPVANAKVGDTVSWSDGMTMSNFTSTSLNRKFDKIIFAGAVRVGN